MKRYIRQISIDEIGESGQKRLIESSVLIIGCGALGSMVAMILAGAGIGRIGIADFDTIEISNLQRQFFFKTSEAGLLKAKVLSDRILDLNPNIIVEEIPNLINKNNAFDIFPNYDLIIDATDNPDSKLLISKICCSLKKTCISGGVSEFKGQVITLPSGDHAFEEYFTGIEDGFFMPCSIGGVIGSTASFCASVQASEAIKSILGIGESLEGKIFVFDLLKFNFNVFSL